MIEDIAKWPSGTVRIVWRGPEDPGLPLTGAHGFCFHHGDVLVCDIAGRGLTIPGGHLDPGESAADCLMRETAEEACVEISNLRLLGFIEADHRLNKLFDGRYPERSVMAISRADVSGVSRFTVHSESRARRFVPADDLATVHHEWNAVLAKALEVALAEDAQSG